MRQFLVHDDRDNVGVAVVNIELGQTVAGATLDNGHLFRVTACESISLGHKIALADLNVGDTVIKYGEDIGRVVAKIRIGEHVHVHNLKTKRW
jgi:(2R)-sulfolactate sulfo-lyase subunit alpha